MIYFFQMIWNRWLRCETVIFKSFYFCLKRLHHQALKLCNRYQLFIKKSFTYFKTTLVFSVVFNIYSLAVIPSHYSDHWLWIVLSIGIKFIIPASFWIYQNNFCFFYSQRWPKVFFSYLSKFVHDSIMQRITKKFIHLKFENHKKNIILWQLWTKKLSFFTWKLEWLNGSNPKTGFKQLSRLHQT